VSNSRLRALELEAALALAIRGKLTVASGAKSDKGDAKSRMFRCEAKYRVGNDDLGCFMPLSIEWLETIYTYAKKYQKIPVLALETEDGWRGVLLPEIEYTAVTPAEIDSDQVNTRSVRVPSGLAGKARSFHFSKIECPCKNWALLPWDLFEQFVEQVQPPAEDPPSGGFTRPTRPATPSARFSCQSSFAKGSSSFGGGGFRGGSSFGRKRLTTESESEDEYQ
jgi:hypothetical protein